MRAELIIRELLIRGVDGRVGWVSWNHRPWGTCGVGGVFWECWKMEHCKPVVGRGSPIWDLFIYFLCYITVNEIF